MKKKRRNVIPGFGISARITISVLSFIILIPMASIVLKTAGFSPEEFIGTVTDKRVVSSYQVSFGCSFVAAIINTIFGLLLAWVLVRYEFPCKRIVDGLIELPFAIPTAVAGIALTTLYSDQGWLGSIFAKWGLKISYTKLGIVLAMIFIGIPFVVRGVQPVLEGLDKQYEEAAEMLGASRFRTFFKVIFPELLPALLTGFGLAFARGVGEYGSVVFIAGNAPYETEIAPLLIVSKLEEFDYTGATAIALVMLLFSFLIMLVINSIQIYTGKFKA